MCNTIVRQKRCCFEVKNSFRKSKTTVIKTLTDTDRVFKKGYYMHTHCYQYPNQPYMRTAGQPNSIYMPDDNFKYQAM